MQSTHTGRVWKRYNNLLWLLDRDALSELDRETQLERDATRHSPKLILNIFPDFQDRILQTSWSGSDEGILRITGSLNTYVFNKTRPSEEMTRGESPFWTGSMPHDSPYKGGHIKLYLAKPTMLR